VAKRDRTARVEPEEIVGAEHARDPPAVEHGQVIAAAGQHVDRRLDSEL
jgi:hypothetical protein